MPDFTFYREVFGGAVLAEGAAFAAVVEAAGAKLCEYERAFTVCYPAADSRAKAVCAIAEEMALTRRALDEAEGRVTSVRVGDVSTGYAALSPAAFVQGAENRYYKAALVYCDIYRGAGLRGCGAHCQGSKHCLAGAGCSCGMAGACGGGAGDACVCGAPGGDGP